MSSTTIVSGRPPIKSEQTQQVSGSVTTVAPLPFALQYEEASSTITYIGEAAAGSATSAAVWRIKRMDTTTGIIILWAGGVATFTNTWTGRAGFTYS